VQAGNSWGVDSVGWSDAPNLAHGLSYGAITYYRIKKKVPCEAVVHQQMQIQCPDGTWVNYGPVNTLKEKIDTTTITNSKNGIHQTKRYP
jgi:hypothetical protein